MSRPFSPFWTTNKVRKMTRSRRRIQKKLLLLRIPTLIKARRRNKMLLKRHHHRHQKKNNRMRLNRVDHAATLSSKDKNKNNMKED